MRIALSDSSGDRDHEGGTSQDEPARSTVVRQFRLQRLGVDEPPRDGGVDGRHARDQRFGERHVDQRAQNRRDPDAVQLLRRAGNAASVRPDGGLGTPSVDGEPQRIDPVDPATHERQPPQHCRGGVADEELARSSGGDLTDDEPTAFVAAEAGPSRRVDVAAATQPDEHSFV
jgi:hypothetical protein